MFHLSASVHEYGKEDNSLRSEVILLAANSWVQHKEPDKYTEVLIQQNANGPSLTFLCHLLNATAFYVLSLNEYGNARRPHSFNLTSPRVINNYRWLNLLIRWGLGAIFPGITSSEIMHRCAFGGFLTAGTVGGAQHSLF